MACQARWDHSARSAEPTAWFRWTLYRSFAFKRLPMHRSLAGRPAGKFRLSLGLAQINFTGHCLTISVTMFWMPAIGSMNTLTILLSPKLKSDRTISPESLSGLYQKADGFS